MKLAVNRADLYYALDSVLPHIKDTLCVSGSVDKLAISATDGHTMAVVQLNPSWANGGAASVHLPKGEAEELLRAVRIQRVAQNDEEVALLIEGPELHVQLAGEDVAEVYDGTADVPWDEGIVLLAARQILRWPPRPSDPLVYDPALLARFKKAKRAEGDRLAFFPAYANDETAAVVTVGSHFLGAIAGMAQPEQNYLESWGLVA